MMMKTVLSVWRTEIERAQTFPTLLPPHLHFTLQCTLHSTRCITLHFTLRCTLHCTMHCIMCCTIALLHGKLQCTAWFTLLPPHLHFTLRCTLHWIVFNAWHCVKIQYMKSICGILSLLYCARVHTALQRKSVFGLDCNMATSKLPTNLQVSASRHHALFSSAMLAPPRIVKVKKLALHQVAMITVYRAVTWPHSVPLWPCTWIPARAAAIHCTTLQYIALHCTSVPAR